MSCSPECLAFMEKCYAEEHQKTQAENAELKKKVKELEERDYYLIQTKIDEGIETERAQWEFGDAVQDQQIQKLKKELDEKDDRLIELIEEKKALRQENRELKDAGKGYFTTEILVRSKEALEENIKLKKELEHREYCLRQDAKGHSPSEVQEYRDEIEELKERMEVGQAIAEKAIANLKQENEKLSAVCLRWQEKADFNLTDSEEEVEDNDPEEYGEYTWKEGLTAEEIAKVDKIDPETGEEKIDMEKEESLLIAQIEGEESE